MEKVLIVSPSDMVMSVEEGIATSMKICERLSNKLLQKTKGFEEYIISLEVPEADAHPITFGEVCRQFINAGWSKCEWLWDSASGKVKFTLTR